MPIAFETLNCGLIPIGFFNIETDGFMVGRYFCFVTDLCGRIESWAHEAPTNPQIMECYVARDFHHVGSIQLAMAGYYGDDILSAVFRRFPFPKEPEAFRQSPEGWRNRGEIEAILASMAPAASLTISFDRRDGAIRIGEYLFSSSVFADILRYIVRGGMPRWRDFSPPDYVLKMLDNVRDSEFWLFSDL